MNTPEMAMNKIKIHAGMSEINSNVLEINSGAIKISSGIIEISPACFKTPLIPSQIYSEASEAHSCTNEIHALYLDISSNIFMYNSRVFPLGEDSGGAS
jgi:hypothetical protein